MPCGVVAARGPPFFQGSRRERCLDRRAKFQGSRRERGKQPVVEAAQRREPPDMTKHCMQPKGRAPAGAREAAASPRAPAHRGRSSWPFECFSRPSRALRCVLPGRNLAIRWFSLAKPRFTTGYLPCSLREQCPACRAAVLPLGPTSRMQGCHAPSGVNVPHAGPGRAPWRQMSFHYAGLNSAGSGCRKPLDPGSCRSRFRRPRPRQRRWQHLPAHARFGCR